MAKKEVTKKEEKTPVAKEHVGGAIQEYEAQGAWGGEDISTEDIVIPKIMLMQPMSDLVTDGVAKIGEFRDSLNTSRILGYTTEKPVEFIVFGTFKRWMEFKDKEFQRAFVWTPENAELKTEEITEAGELITRDVSLNFYCLLPDDIESGEAFPYVISCRMTSKQAGKDLSTHIKKLQMFKKPSAAKVFVLTATKETNDKGTFFVLHTAVGRDATATEQAAAYEWYKLLGKSKVRVDDSDVNKTTATASPTHMSDSTEAQSIQ